MARLVEISGCRYEIPDSKNWSLTTYREIRSSSEPLGPRYYRLDYIFNSKPKKVIIRTWEISDNNFPGEEHRVINHIPPLNFNNPPNSEMEYPLAFFLVKKESKEKNMVSNHYQVGMRVLLRMKVGNKSVANGTVTGSIARTGRGSGAANSMVTVCLDNKWKGVRGAATDHLCGLRRSLTVTTDCLALADMEKPSTWTNVPRDVGVVVHKSAGAKIFKEINIPYNAVGRVARGTPGGMADIYWIGYPTTSGMKIREPRLYVSKRSRVPWSLLKWVRFNTATLIVQALWGSTMSETEESEGSKYRKGNLVVVPKGSPSVRLANGDRQRNFITGSVLYVDKCDSNLLYVRGYPLDSSSAEFVGRVHAWSMEPFPYTFFPKDSKVEVVAKIVFKKKDLSGSKGRVLLPTDTDGDVGIEFESDVGGGSLDGEGKSGKCLYLNAGAIRRSE